MTRSEALSCILKASSMKLGSQLVFLSTCTKVSFVFGVVVGFTLKRRLRRWAVKLLKRIKDDE